MKLFFDEAGNTGSIKLNNGKFNFSKQTHFVLGCVLIPNNKEEMELVQKYKSFKEHFSIDGEIKGNELFKKTNNDMLEYFIKNIISDTNSYICLYDKKFYLSTLMLLIMFGRTFQIKFSNDFYGLASLMVLEDDNLFAGFDYFMLNKTINGANKFLKQIINYQFINEKLNCLKETAKMYVKDKNEELLVDDIKIACEFNTKGINNLVNLTAIGETVLSIKTDYKEANKNINYYHDKMSQFEKDFSIELKNVGINIKFLESKESELIQFADNIASISFKLLCFVVDAFKKKMEWAEENVWMMKIVSQFFQKIGINNFKYVLPLHDIAMIRTVVRMFDKCYPSECRKNLFFNPIYLEEQSNVLIEMSTTIPDEESLEILET